VGASTYDYAFDGSGNMLSESTSRRFSWNHGDELAAFAIQVAGAEPSVHAQYLYDAAGRRVKKLVRRQGGQLEVVHYVDDTFEHHRWSGSSSLSENTSHHVMDGTQRIAVVRRGPPHPDDRSPGVVHHLPDHLHSSTVTVDAEGRLVGREEFTPYGETTFGGVARKRYRFTGKERELEAGLYYHGARYYAPWLARWVSCDPAGLAQGPAPLGPATSRPNLYVYANANPLVFVDPDGNNPVIDLGTGISSDEGQPKVQMSARTGRHRIVEGGHYVRNPIEEVIVELELNGGDAESLRQLDRVIKEYKPAAWALALAFEHAGVDIREDPIVKIMSGMLGLVGAGQPGVGPGGARAAGGPPVPAGRAAAARSRPPTPAGANQLSLPNRSTSSTGSATSGPLPRPSDTHILQHHAIEANARLALNPSLTAELGLLSPPALVRARAGSLVAARYGQALENLVDMQVQANPRSATLYLRLGGANRPDWVPRTPAGASYDFVTGTNFDLFTLNPKATRLHLGRPYGATMEPIYYLRPPNYVFE
jgi:RHS repeat-associated protein